MSTYFSYYSQKIRNKAKRLPKQSFLGSEILVFYFFALKELQSVHSTIVGFDSCVPTLIDDNEQ